MMNTEYIIKEFRKNKLIFLELLENLDDFIVNWKPSETKWSLLEIICHLYDEECEDFRARIDSTLQDPNKEFNQIDPEGWVLSRKYAEQDFNLKLSKFIEERNKSIQYLENLKSPKWDNYYQHPKCGNMTAKMFFTNWLAHDYLHIKQILKIKFDYLSNTTNEELNYAGKW